MTKDDRLGWIVFYLAIAAHVLWATGTLLYFLFTDKLIPLE